MERLFNEWLAKRDDHIAVREAFSLAFVCYERRCRGLAGTIMRFASVTQDLKDEMVPESLSLDGLETWAIVTEAPPQKNEIVAELIEKIMTPRDIKSKQVVALGGMRCKKTEVRWLLVISDARWPT
ncbi:hypothetical protein AK812_SmicGene41186 [Symbiodinium microadriaticum]|uniref:Uncharacterized protein n=1 Tax=Symbiodinium microadriaticum TaxID=2951 RepID=A0A1Q9C6R8_SYMMI|nr:hypothetical protein AK812_SmicGene41186 [Symbiodinium microadriaticum]